MTTTRARLFRSERGMAVVSALMIVAAVAVLVTGLFQRQAAEVRAVENEQARIQARWLLLGALDWSRLVLREDARRNTITRLGELWATPVSDTRIARAGDDRVALFSGRIDDEQGKFNLTNLAAGGVPQPEPLAGLQRRCEMLGLPGSIATRIAVRVASSQPPAPKTGQESGQKVGQQVAAKGPTAPPLRSIEDLEGIQGVDNDTVEALRPFVTVLPEISAVNANTAPAEVLAAVVPGLSLGRARALTSQRNGGTWFNDAADFSNRIGDRDITISPTQIVTVSRWFLVTGTVTLERATVTMQALVSRPSATSTTVVWNRESN